MLEIVAAVDLAPLAEHDVPYAGAVTAVVALRYVSDWVLQLVAGITATVAKDPNKSRAEEALDVLKALRKDESPPSPRDADVK